jgi:hypothetical protein
MYGIIFTSQSKPFKKKNHGGKIQGFKDSKIQKFVPRR